MHQLFPFDAVVPPVGPVGRRQRTTMPAWISAGIGMNTPVLRGLQQQEALWTPRGGEITDPPSPPIVGRRRGRSNSGDIPAPRPRSRSRHQSPASHHGDPGRDTRGGGRNGTQEKTLLVGMIGCRQRSTPLPREGAARPRQRPRVSFAETTQNHRPRSSALEGVLAGLGRLG